MDVATGLQRVADLAREVKAVDPTIRRTAELVAVLVCRRLGIPTVRTRWLSSADSGGKRGVCYPERPGEVWVRAGQTVAATVETTAHEARHAWQFQADQFRWLMKGLETYDEREADARGYGLAIRRELT